MADIQRTERAYTAHLSPAFQGNHYEKDYSPRPRVYIDTIAMPGPARRRSQDNEDESWSVLLKNFSAVTTFHGVRYLAEDSRFFLRKVIWLTVLLTVVVTFAFLSGKQLLYLVGHPKTVNVEVVYNDSIIFPSITLCNQNLFRKSAAHSHGLYDLIKHTFKPLANVHTSSKSNKSSLGSGEDEESINDAFIKATDHYLEGIVDAYQKFDSVTADVCKAVCLEIESDKCCSLVYIRATSTCYITPLEPRQSVAVNIKPKLGIDYYQRKKCNVKESTECDFSSGFCNLTPDVSSSLHWKVVSGRGQSSVYRPAFDHSATGTGNYTHVATKYTQPNLKARLLSPYLVSNDRTCLDFFYQIYSGILLIQTGIPGRRFETRWSRTTLPTEQWERASLELPEGYYRVVFEATTRSATDKVNVALDDIRIGTCRPAPECRETPMGIGYSGRQNITVSGKPCDFWDNFPTNDQFIGMTGESETHKEHNNYCRNRDADTRGPWCYTNARSGRSEYCNIPVCECANRNHFRCANGICLSSSLLCDGKNDCGDDSDEEDCSSVQPSVNCTFEENNNCSYLSWPESRLIWNTKTELEHYIEVVSAPGRYGDTASLFSPDVQASHYGCLQLQAYIIEAQLEIYLSPTPVQLSWKYICTANVREGVWNFLQFDVELFFEETINNTNGVWTLYNQYDGMEYTDSSLLLETYHFVFHGILLSDKRSIIRLDNITLLPDSCPFVESPVSTDSIETTPADVYTTVSEFSSTDFMSSIGINMTGDYNISTATSYQNRSTLDQDGETSAMSDNQTTSPQNTDIQDTTDISHTFPSDTTEFPNQTDTLSTNTVSSSEYPEEMEPKCLRNIPSCMSCLRNLHLPASHNNLSVSEQFDDTSSLSCDFSNLSTCGYRFMSSNVLTRWFLQPVSGQHSNDTDVAEVDYFATAMGSVRMGDWTKLVSPMQEVTNTSCLQFAYQVFYTDIRVYRYSAQGVTQVLEIIMDGQDKTWHKADITLEPGYFGLVFELRYGKDLPSDTNSSVGGFDNITQLAGHCFSQDLSSSHVGVNCTFIDVDTCGYRDVSPGMRRWFRSKEYENSVPGQYFMRVSETDIGKLHRGILSPNFTVDNTSCLKFYYKMKGKGKREVSTLAVTLLDPRKDGPEEVIWAVRSVTDNNWHYAEAQLPSGNHQLLFELNTALSRAAIDHIKVVPGECGFRDCSPDADNPESEYTCRSRYACIPNSNVCDELANCYEGEDEDHDKCFKDSSEEAQKTTDGEHFSIGGLDYENSVKEANASDATLCEMYDSLSQQGEDLIVRCIWEGEECSHVNFTKQVTDFGLCYTFNAGAEHKVLDTSETGSRFGLRLTLNIEQYEYMQGPNSDAGIKAFLHPSNEVPQVRDLGFAMPPGTHTLVGIMKNEAESLRDPWGDCGSDTLKYFKEYSYSACMLEKETKRLFDKCYCRDVYMPYKSDNTPRVCTLEEFFNCSVPFLNSLELRASSIREKPCPKPCNLVVYEPSLSYATLSTLSVDEILGSGPDTLKVKYINAIETAQRTTTNFVKTLKIFDDISRTYVEFQKFVTQYMGEAEESMFAKLWIATQTMSKTFKHDLEFFFDDLDQQVEVYDACYNDSKSLFFYYISDFSYSIKDLDQLMHLSTNSEQFHSRIWGVASLASAQSEIVLQTFSFLRLKLQNKTLALEMANRGRSEKYNGKYLPQNHWSKTSNCKSNMEDLERILNATTKTLDKLKEYPVRRVDDHFRNLASEFHTNMTRFFQLVNLVDRCLTSYKTLLDEVVSWRNSALEKAEAFVSEPAPSTSFFDFENQYKAIQEDSKKAERASNQYSLREISMLSLVSTFHSEESQNEVITNIETFTDRIKTRVSEPLGESIRDVERTLQNQYEEAVNQASKLEKYLEEFFYYTKASNMIIWKLPKANLDNAEQLDDEGRELWKVWDRQMPVDTFAKDENRSQKYIMEGLSGYFNPLFKNHLEHFEEQLIVKKENLLVTIEKAQDQYFEYQTKRKIDHTFVIDNFMNVDFYFKQLKFEKVIQMKAYEIADFFSDVGGFMGLLLGASALTICEILDLFIYNGIQKMVYFRRQYGVDVQRETSHNDITLNSSRPNHNSVNSV